MSPQAQKCLLSDVFRVLGVAQHAESVMTDRLQVLLDGGLVRLRVSGLDCRHQLLIVCHFRSVLRRPVAWVSLPTHQYCAGLRRDLTRSVYSAAFDSQSNCSVFYTKEGWDSVGVRRENAKGPASCPAGPFLSGQTEPFLVKRVYAEYGVHDYVQVRWHGANRNLGVQDACAVACNRIAKL